MSDQPHTIITRLIVKNYPSLADIDIELSPRTVLVGPNNAGKSNLVDVFRFVRDSFTRGLDAAILDRRGMSAILPWSPRRTSADVHIDLHLGGHNWSGKYGFILGAKG